MNGCGVLEKMTNHVSGMGTLLKDGAFLDREFRGTGLQGKMNLVFD